MDAIDNLATDMAADADLYDEPIDWPARFRAAGDAVEAFATRWPITAQHFDDIADRLESGLLPPEVVAAIGRALLGEETP